jgi:hypothetical protein
MEQVSGSSFSALIILGFLDVDVVDALAADTDDSFDMMLSISVKKRWHQILYPFMNNSIYESIPSVSV